VAVTSAWRPLERRGAPAIGRPIGALLVAEGLVTAEQVGEALEEQRTTGEKVGAVLVRRGRLSEDQLARFLARLYALPYVTLPAAPIPREVLRLVPAALARKYEVLPLERTTTSLTLAMADPTNLSAVDETAFRTGLRVAPVIVRPGDIRQAIAQHYGPERFLAEVIEEAQGGGDLEVVVDGTPGSLDVQELRASADDVPVVRLVNTIVLEALRAGASDIHLEPEATCFRVRLRVDGVLRELTRPAKRLEAPVVSRIKIMASLDIAERRLSQDGRLRLRHDGREVDVRVNTLPTTLGEAVSLRVLDRARLEPDLDGLGLGPTALEELRGAIASPHGMVLITGPTGSGKTTTLYAAVEALRARDLNIVTVEDPVEYDLPGVNQVAVNEASGLTFAAALRAFLRHDPDVMLVGEMRDLETAQVATRAAVTGHLVLTTLHTNDAATAVTRLADMGVARHLLDASLRLVLSQRLVRRLCPRCREPYQVDEPALARYGWTPRGDGPVTLYRPRGCAACQELGFKGREAVVETLPARGRLRELLAGDASAAAIRRAAQEEGLPTLREAGLRKALEGLTTVDEVLRATYE